MMLSLEVVLRHCTSIYAFEQSDIGMKKKIRTKMRVTFSKLFDAVCTKCTIPPAPSVHTHKGESV